MGRNKRSVSISSQDSLVSNVRKSHDFFFNHFTKWPRFPLISTFLNYVSDNILSLDVRAVTKHDKVCRSFIENDDRKFSFWLECPIFQTYLTCDPNLATSAGLWFDDTDIPHFWIYNKFSGKRDDRAEIESVSEKDSDGVKAACQRSRSPILLSPLSHSSSQNSSPSHSIHSNSSEPGAAAELQSPRAPGFSVDLSTPVISIVNLPAEQATEGIVPPPPSEVSPSVVNNGGPEIPTCSNEPSGSASTVPMDTSSKPSFRFVFIPISDNHLFLKSIFDISPGASAKLIGKFIHLTLNSQEEFEQAHNLFIEKGVSYRYNDPSMGKPLKFVLRGLPASTNPDSIRDALSPFGLEPLNIAYMRSSKTRAPMPLFVVDLPPIPAPADILQKVTLINHLPVSFSPFIRRKPPTCHRCQGFFHSSLTCKLPPRCVICSGQHSSKECKFRGQPDKFLCCHCQGNHTANYSKCPKNPLNRGNSSKSRAVRSGASNSHSTPPAQVSVEPSPISISSPKSDPRTSVEISPSHSLNPPVQFIPRAVAQSRTPRKKVQISEPVNRINSNSVPTDDTFPDPFSANSPNIGFKPADSSDFAQFFKLIKDFFFSEFFQKFKQHLSSILAIFNDSNIDLIEKFSRLFPILLAIFEA